MHRFVPGPSFTVPVALIFLSVLVYNHLKKKQKRVEEESIDGAFAPSFNFATTATGDSNQYDVFLSFRGLDTRKGFTDHLYRSLINEVSEPISVFKDDNNLEIGDDFDVEILAAITRSKILIPIISENYATSKWCLRELVHIMECKKRKSHMILPIFYKVAPSDVRYLKGNFGNAFHSQMKKWKKRFDEKDIEKGKRALKDIEEGKRALEEVSNLNGWESKKFADGREGELVEDIIKTIRSKLRHNFQLDVSKHLVGVDDHINKIRNWVNIPASHARMIGIYGMGGIGKTTLAKVIYNKLSNDFVHRKFLQDIREGARNGIPHLQSLLTDMQSNQHQSHTVDEGIWLIKSKFQNKKVLILLDDVDQENQLNALARERDWFGTGSIIIVTTRNKAILDKFGVDLPYELNELNKEHSLLLFKKHAFPMGQCPKNFEGISRDILSTMGGLPLAIKVIGSSLYEEMDGRIWWEMWKKLKCGRNDDVQKILQISYDVLEKGYQQIFLDIACFFIGEDSKFAIYMWDDCQFYPNLGLKELKLRCLIKMDEYGRFWMHDQLRDLGRHIFCQRQPPERCLKPWLEDKALRSNMQRESLREGYSGWPRGYSSKCTSELFKNLPSSRFLSFCWTTISGDFNELFPELRWLRWLYIEPDIFSSAINLHLSNLVVLELSKNKLTHDWGGWSLIMAAEQLKVLNLSNSKELRYTPNLSAFTKLEILILSQCCKLKQVNPSISKLKSLISLDLCRCSNLKKLPEGVGELQELKELLLNDAGITEIPMSVYSLSKLEKLDIRSCRSLVEIPLEIGNLSSLQYLDLHLCESLREIPPSIENLSSLQQLKLGNCWSLTTIPNSIVNLSSLEQLDLAGNKLSEIPSSIGDLSSLKQLQIDSCQLLIEIPSSIGDLSSLKHLQLGFCVSLRKIPNSIGNLSSLERLNLMGCNSLTEIPNSIGNLSSLEHLNLAVCESLREIPSSIGNLSSLKQLNLGGCKSLTEIPSSIGNLSSLDQLDLGYCDSLTEISSSIGNLSSLKQLDLGGFRLLTKIPNSIGNLSSLERLKLVYFMSLIKIPNSIGNLSSLKRLDLAHCHSLTEIPSSIEKLSSLKQLDLRCCTSLTEIPNSIGNLSSLEQLDLMGCKSLTEIPSSIGNLSSLRKLQLEGCVLLRKIPNSIGNLSSLKVFGLKACKSLREIPRGLQVIERNP